MKQDNIFNIKNSIIKLNKIMFTRPIRRLQNDQLRSSGQAATLRKNEGVIIF